MINKIQCVNDSCSKKRYCKLFNERGMDKRRFESHAGSFSGCNNFDCYQHQYAHIHGQHDRECIHCGLIEKQSRCVWEHEPFEPLEYVYDSGA